MTVTTTQAANLALIKLGSDTISSLSDDNKPARLCNAVFDLIRDEMLRQHPWNFAMAREQLVADVDDAPDFEFSYQFPLPDDYLRLVNLYLDRSRFKIEGDFILTDSNPIDIIYIRQMADPTEWDAMFLEAFATRLAAEISFALTGSNTLQQIMMADYERKLAKAKTVDAQENYSDGFIVDDLHQSRIFRTGEYSDFWWDRF